MCANASEAVPLSEKTGGNRGCPDNLQDITSHHVLVWSEIAEGCTEVPCSRPNIVHSAGKCLDWAEVGVCAMGCILVVGGSPYAILLVVDAQCDAVGRKECFQRGFKRQESTVVPESDVL